MALGLPQNTCFVNAGDQFLLVFCKQHFMEISRRPSTMAEYNMIVSAFLRVSVRSWMSWGAHQVIMVVSILK